MASQVTGISLAETASWSWAQTLTEEAIAELKEVFSLFDTNGDGHISRVELEEGMMKMGLVYSSAEVDEMVQQIDSDGDETIDFGEFLSFMAVNLEEAKVSDVVLMEAFRQFDHGNKGYLTPVDIHKAVSILGDESDTKRQYEDLIREADLDNDGKINYQEFANIVVSGQMHQKGFLR